VLPHNTEISDYRDVTSPYVSDHVIHGISPTSSGARREESDVCETGRLTSMTSCAAAAAAAAGGDIDVTLMSSSNVTYDDF